MPVTLFKEPNGHFYTVETAAEEHRGNKSQRDDTLVGRFVTEAQAWACVAQHENHRTLGLLGMSAEQLLELADKARKLAEHLKRDEPSYDLALEAGIRNKSYQTVRWGRVADYAGEVEITLADGRRWKAVGHGPKGSPEYIDRQGFIEFIPLD